MMIITHALCGKCDRMRKLELMNYDPAIHGPGRGRRP